MAAMNPDLRQTRQRVLSPFRLVICSFLIAIIPILLAIISLASVPYTGQLIANMAIWMVLLGPILFIIGASLSLVALLKYRNNKNRKGQLFSFGGFLLNVLFILGDYYFFLRNFKM